MWIKMLIIAIVALLPLYAQAQQDSINRTKTSSDIDYTLPGASMPFLQFMCYKDTSSSEIASAKKHSKKHAPARGTYTLMAGNELNNDGNLLVMIFSPECSHCKAVSSMLQQHIDLFKNAELLLITTGIMKEYIPEFVSTQKLKKYPSILVGVDSSGFVPNTFLYQPLPQINIYNKERKLIKTFTREVPIDSLRKYID
jgi:hypothetical protein